MTMDSRSTETIRRAAPGTPRWGQAEGFSLVEFLISSLVLLVIAAGTFGVLTETQRASSFQTEIQAVLDNMRIAGETLPHYILQAGNNPFGAGFSGITIVSGTEVQLRTDVTGSGGPGEPDKGDSDGDANDLGEDVTIRYNAGSQSIELVPNGGAAQTIADHISAFSMQYFDGSGVATTVGDDVRKVTISITGVSSVADPQTGQFFSVQESSDIHVATRN